MANKQLNVFLNVKDNYSKEMKSFNSSLKVSKSELKVVDEQLKANSKDSELLAKKQQILAKQTDTYNNQMKSTGSLLKASTVELEKKANSCGKLEKELKDLEKVYQSNLKSLGSEDKLTKQSLKSYEKKQKELRSANKEYSSLEKSVTNLNVKMNNLNANHVKASSEFAKTTYQIQNMDKEVSKVDESLDKLAKKDYSRIADGMMMAGTALGTALVGIGSLGANESMQFEYGQAKIGSIVDVSKEELSNLGNTVIKTSNKFGIASKDIQNSIYQALSSSVKFEDVNTVLEQSIQLSKGGFADLTSTLDVLTNVMNSYGKGASEIQGISDKLFATTVVGKTTIGELSTQFSGLSVIAANTGVSLDQALGGLALLTQSGTSTSEAVTQIRALLNELGNDTTKVGQQVKKNLGMSFQDAMKNGAELDDVLIGLDKSAKASGGSLSNMLGSIEAKQASMQIMAEDGAKFDSILNDISNSVGATQEAFNKVDETKLATMEKSAQKLKNSMLSVGDAVSPYIDKVSSGIEKIAEVIKETDTNTVNLLATISAVTLGLGATLKVTSSISSALTVIKPLIGAVGLGFGQIALIGGGIAAVLGIFDALNTTLDEQNKKLEEASDNLSGLKGKYDELSQNTNRTEAQDKILRGLEKEIELNERILEQEKAKTIRNEVFGAGRLGSGLLGKAGGRQKDIEYIQYRIKELEEYAEQVTDQATKDAITVELGKQYQELGMYTDEFKAYMESLNDSLGAATEKEKKQIAELNKFADSLGNINEVIMDSSKELGEKVEDSTYTVEKMAQSISNLSSVNTETSESIEFLNSCINSLNEGETLTGDQIVRLLDLYPNLTDSITEQNGVYTISKEVLGQVRDESVKTANQRIEDEIAVSKELAAQTQSRIEMYRAELEAQKQLAKARASLDSFGTGVIGKGRNAMGAPGSNNYISEVEDKIKLEKKALKDVLAGIDKLEIEQQKFNIATSGGNTKKGSGISNKSGNDKKDKEVFDKRIKSILSSSNELERTIGLTQQQLEMAELKGNKESANKLNQQLIEQQKQKRDILHQQAEELRKLLSITTDVEIKATINSEIMKLQDEFHDSKMEQYQDEIDLLQKKYDIERKIYDDRLRDIELEQMLLDEDSDGYIQREYEKMEIIKLHQESIYAQIEKLRELDLADNQDAIKTLKDQWYDYEKDRVSLTKSMAEQRRKAELESVNAKVDHLKAQQDAQKKIHNEVLKMIKQEAEAKKKAIQDEIDGYEKIINARKQALRDEQDKSSYEEELSEKQKVVTDLENKLMALGNDNSESAKAARLKLQEELAKATKDLNKFQLDQSIKDQEAALDKELENFKDEKQEELDEIEDSLSKEGKMREEAIKLLESRNKSLYDKLKKWNSEYGSMASSELDELWSTATTSIDGYTNSNQSLLEIMKEITAELKKQQKLYKDKENQGWKDYTTNGDLNIGGSNNSSTQNKSTIEKMKSNSEKWENTNNQDERDRLSNENKKLGDSIGAYRDPVSGKWYVSKDKKIPLFHKGLEFGRTGDGLKPNEMITKLTKDEWVFTNKQFSNLTKNLNGIVKNDNQIPNIELHIDKFMDNVSISNDMDLQRVKKELINAVYKDLVKHQSNIGIRPKLR